MDLGLSRITRLIRDHHCQLPWKAIHIAGTNGKGSTSAFLSGLLHHTGVPVGRFNSPHLIHRHDCITINEKTIDRGLFLELENEIKKRDTKAAIKATPFELLTATAFEAFAHEKVTIGVVECGLGGARDATNVLNADEVICSVITSISKDHQDVLGPGLKSIAREKAGIMKKGVPVLIDGIGEKSVQDVLKKQADLIGSPFFSRGDGLGLLGVDDLKDPRLVDLSMNVGYQLRNLSLAYKAFQIVRENYPEIGRDVSPQEALEVAGKVRKSWRGRTEWISIAALTGRSNKVLVDGAHNPKAAMELRRYVSSQAGVDRCVTWIIAMSETKDVARTLKRLIRQGDRVVVTEFGPVDGMPWVKPSSVQTLQDVASRLTSKVRVSTSPDEALCEAVKITPEDELIVIGGSLYLVGDVLRMLEISHDGL
jgi:dihydrofolate synthase